MAERTAIRDTGNTKTAADDRVRRRKFVVFVVLFTVLVALGSASELFLLRAKMGGAYQQFIAGAAGATLGVVGVPVRVDETTLTVNGHSVRVVIECTGVKATAIFCAAVLAFPCTWRAKAVGLVTGLIGVGVLNLGRIALLAVVSGYRNDWFDGVHAVLMQGFLVLFVAPLWIAWMLWANRRTAAAARNNG